MIKELKVTPNQWVHITRKNLGEEVTLEPSRGFTPMGVSFAPSVEQALDAIPLFFTGEKNAKENGVLLGKGKIRHFTYYVYTPVKQYDAVVPRKADDTDISGERRVLKKVKAKRLGIIDVTSRESHSGKQIYDLVYHWREKEQINKPKRLKDWWDEDIYKNHIVKRSRTRSKNRESLFLPPNLNGKL